MKSLKLILALATAGALSACASLEIDKSKVAQKKKVAVVGFGVRTDVPQNALDVAFKKKDSGTRGLNFGDSSAQETPAADEMYSKLVSKLTAQFGWKVASQKELSESGEYANFYRSKTEGVQSRPFVGQNQIILRPTKILDAWAIEVLKPPQRQELIRKLGVDAIVVADLAMTFENQGGLKKLIGAGDLHPQVTSVFKLYDVSQEKPIWFDPQAQGPVLEEGVDHMLGFHDTSKFDQLGVKAAELSFDKLLDRYKRF